MIIENFKSPYRIIPDWDILINQDIYIQISRSGHSIFLTLGHPDFLYLHEITDSSVSSTKVTFGGTKVLHCFRPSLLQIWQSPIGFSHGAIPTTYQYQ